jgi:hypothetical protein
MRKDNLVLVEVPRNEVGWLLRKAESADAAEVVTFEPFERAKLAFMARTDLSEFEMTDGVCRFVLRVAT